MDVLKETNAGNLGQKKAGKVRDIYDQGDKLILITTDRHSSFDRIIAHIPWKGQVLNQVSAWWFEQTKAIVSNQVLAVPDPNVMVVRKYKIVPVEAVMRGYLTGVTDTSIWTRYQKGIRQFDDLNLPDDMKKNEKLPKAVFDPTTKEEKHDAHTGGADQRGISHAKVVRRSERDSDKTLHARTGNRGKSRSYSRGHQIRIRDRRAGRSRAHR
jgi:phosphoribosylaminoimidazole-succinocarboxamide synthase